MTRPLGREQQAILRLLRERGPWHPACGWYWRSNSATERILESLVRRGLVEWKADGIQPDNGKTHITYTLRK